MKCKNCGAPIERVEKPVTGIKPYWRHERPYTHTGRLWCYPTSNMTDMHEFYVMAAEPEETDA